MHSNDFIDVSVDCAIFGFDYNQLKILLVEQKKLTEDHSPQYALPGDLVYRGESLDDAARRVLFELTHLDGVYLKQFHAFGDPNRLKKEKDQSWLKAHRKTNGEHVITIGYYSLIKMKDFSPIASSFAGKVEWLSINEVPNLGFDHDDILEVALENLKFDTQNNNIAFELLPEKFTLTQLQRLHEVILNKDLDKRNFRKTMKKLENLIPLDEKQKDALHKPAQLFSFKPNNNNSSN